ncbi:MAG: CehA/McbA family metallohydrolase [Henriciella sp.]
MRFLLALTVSLVCTMATSQAQWTNRYPKVDDQRHHIYLEGYELPILSSGPNNPAVSPDGGQVAFAAYGWIWVLDLASHTATRITSGPDLDDRPRWSPDGQHLAFTRDTGTDMAVALIDLASGQTQEINTPKIDLDPEFSADGASLYFSSSMDGQLNIWRSDLTTGEMTQITALEGHQRNPRLTQNDDALIYLHLDWPARQIRRMDLATGDDDVIQSTSIAGQASFDVHPQEDIIAFAWPDADDYRILTSDLNDPAPTGELTEGPSYAYQPGWNHDGGLVYFVEQDAKQQFKLMRVSVHGGSAEPVMIENWDWGQPSTTLRIKTLLDGAETPARLSVTDSTGHPVANPSGPTYFDSQNGIHYFYTDGSTDLEVAAGEVTIQAVYGIMGRPETVSVQAASDQDNDVDISLTEIWDAKAAGYRSADFHFHMNYDGPFRHVTGDIGPLVDGENVDVSTPQSANLHNRLMDRAFLAENVTTERGNLIKFAQEVRSHFHGHIGIVGAPDFYYPWFWGPGYPDLSHPDLSNADVIAFAEAQEAAIGTYVHTIDSNIDPFLPDNLGSIPLEFVSDSVLSDEVGLELICAWSDELGTAELWYRLLNIGKPVIAMAGTDMFVDFHRTPAVGAARIYAEHPDGEIDWVAYVSALKSGKSFVSNGPALQFEIGNGSRPGDVIASGEQDWSVELAAALAVERVELLVNGKVVWSDTGVSAGQSKRYSGTVSLPEGGWVAARAYGGDVRWPVMESYPFAHSSPVWIDHVGSTEPGALAAASADLIRALDFAETRASESYEGAEVTKLMGRLDAARAALGAGEAATAF